MNHAEKRRFLINSLINENSEYADIHVPIDKNGQKLKEEKILDLVKVLNVYIEKGLE